MTRRKMRALAHRGSILAAAIVIWVVGAATVEAANSHRIKSGETLSEIAEAYDIPLSVLAAENRISNFDLIIEGSVLSLPVSSGSTRLVASTASTSLYRVQPGDTLWTIAATRRLTLDQLIAANPEIADPNRIVIDQRITIPGPGQTAASNSAVRVQPTGGDVRSLLSSYARSYGLDPTLVQAVAWQESGWNQRMVSSSGALGVMQIMPATGAWLARDVVGQPLDVANSAADNIHAGAAYLRYLIDRTDSVELGLAAYYQGPGSLQRNGMLRETERYISSVMAIRSYIMVYGTPPTG